MKRHITKLEQRLIDNGFSLKEKYYYGKHSEKTFYYVYSGIVSINIDNEEAGVLTFIELNPKRDYVKDVKIMSPYMKLIIGISQVKRLNEIVYLVEEQLKNIVNVDTTNNEEEQLEIAECVECENE
jgi:hypothetical protein